MSDPARLRVAARAGMFLALSVLSAVSEPALAQAAGNAAGAAGAAPATLPLLVGQGGNGSSFSVPVQTLLFF
ncbi:MAG: hypothetical protein RL375_3322, partial [Pseudomonadota bacterium]